MTVAITVRVKGLDRLRRSVHNLSPEQNDRWLRTSLLKGGLVIQRSAAKDHIRRGGSGPPVPDILTSRTGRLRASIRVDRTNVPRSISIGSDVIYAAVHELGQHARISNYPKRPFLQPALDSSIDEVSRIFEREWFKAGGRL